MTTTEYAGNYIYENSVLKFFSQPEGYVEPNGVSYEYVYQYRAERLKNVQWTFLANEPAGARRGNVRLSYSDPNDSYQDILDSDLTNSYSGWVHNGAVTSELINGTLRVDVNSAYEGIRNELPNLTVSPGDVLDITLVFDKGNTLSNVRLYFQELDANGNHLSWNTMDANLQTGTHNYTYTVNAANRLTLRIDKDNTNTGSLTSFYVDHVSVTTGALEILEENNYYPFGLKQKGYNVVVSSNSNSMASKYKYNGKELNKELGLDWYDFGFRNYDAVLGRWMNIDPLAENYYSYSAYSSMMNNPVSFIDPDGRFTIDITGNKSKEALAELQASVSTELNLSMKDGRLSYTLVDSEATLSDDAQKLVNAIDDPYVHVNVSATDNDYISTGAGVLIGTFMGNIITGGFTPPSVDSSLEGNGIINQVETFQEINVSALSGMDKINHDPGQTTLHEITESYLGGKLVQANGKATGFGQVSGGEDYASAIYYLAHEAAAKQSGDVTLGYFDKNGVRLNIKNAIEFSRLHETRAFTGPNLDQIFHTVKLTKY
ncbi:RHS repeat-associated core domain-containing protein [uncultured Psychroserpens sp.]|uniref:RHS repeat-associated core domain-containing protein n=1 Tax=uncultured Psychroserpens sp. TaxID=255436 RepID=UPI002620E490|nr:RHS repeat-associated core domain-containing protein [uncultured Psychroserpens sp.]